MKHSRTILSLSAVGMALFSIDALAVFPGTNVSGYCSVSPDLMAAPANVNETQSTIIKTIADATKMLHAGQLQQLAAQKNVINQETQGLIDFIRKLTAAEDEVRYERSTASFNLPAGICNEPQISADLAAGKIAQGKMATAIKNSVTHWDQGQVTAYANTQLLAKTPPAQSSATALFDPVGNSSSTAADVTQYINLLTAPTPPLKLTAAQTATPAGTEQKLRVSAWQLQAGYAQDALTYIATLHQPTVDGAQFVTLWQPIAKNSGGTAAANPPEYNTASRTISPAGALETQIRARYGNSDWYKQLANEGQSGVLREITQMTALSIKEDEISLTLAEHLASISAASYAADIAQSNADKLTQGAGLSIDQTTRGN